MSIKVSGVVKKFGDFTALGGIDLEVRRGELIALLGPSGSGKTTLLRIIAGIEAPDSGTVFFSNEDTKTMKVSERRVGFVFQHYALFRHMTVAQNVAFGLEVRPRATRPSRKEIRSKVETLLKLVQLDRMASRFPSELSGGQRQRVALARALAIEPSVLLLDEPFGALDAKVRRDLRQWLRRLHDELHITSIFVTHDQEEALELADRVVLMNEGRIEQAGAPDEIYHRPANPFVYDFLGKVNLFHCRLEDGQVMIGNTAIALKGFEAAAAQSGKFYVRPHLLEIVRDARVPGAIPAKVIAIHAAGPLARIELAASWGETMQVELTHERSRELALQRGEAVFVVPKDGRFFSQDYSI